jgi:murein DD-endopeptidase MepM/ murein hydrolase activator NlpD
MLRTRIPALAIVPLVLALLAGAVAGAAPIDDARRERDAAQAAAIDAAQRYSDALSEQARQEAEIARLEREIPILRARAEELRLQVQERSIEMYKQGSPMPLERLLDAEGAVEASRAIELTTKAAQHDRELATELSKTAKKLEEDEKRLRELKVFQDQLVTKLAELRSTLDLMLADASIALDRMEKVLASQAEFNGPDAAANGRLANGAAVCPIAGPMVFVNDWGAPRSGGRTHKGNDLLAPFGTPNVAVTDGWIEQNMDTLGGQGINLHGNDGVVYYYAHLSRYEGPDRIVARGEVIGYVGDTGNARGGPPHTHFGMKPEGGEYVNPYPTLRVLCTG